MKRPNVEVRIAKFEPASCMALDKPAILRVETDTLARTGGGANGFVRLYSDAFIADFEALEMRAMAWLEEQR